MISTRLLRRSSATSAEVTRAVPARLIAGITEFTTETTPTTAATVSKTVEMAFSMARPPYAVDQTRAPGRRSPRLRGSLVILSPCRIASSSWRTTNPSITFMGWFPISRAGAS
jgi:hypothetical protein